MTSLQLPVGFQFAGVRCGLKSASDRPDVALILSDVPAVAAGVYTQNLVVAAPVVLCRSRTPLETVRAVVVNSGNANACTGQRGQQDAQQMCRLTASALQRQMTGQSVTEQQVLVMSTGVIGRFLPMEKVSRGIEQAAVELAQGETAFLRAAEGILTTDQGRKVTTRSCQLGSRLIRLAGMAKGAGMIGPNMATMLCCVVTDAPLAVMQAQRLLRDAANLSFNNISVEGHTSTNDSMLLLANGMAGGQQLTGDEEQVFAEHLQAMCIELAKQIPADGEGAAHLIEVRVVGADSSSDARQIAVEIARSNLVKCAVRGGDPNWGRIVSAAGYAGAEFDPQQVDLKVNGIELFRRGEPVSFDARQASQAIRQSFDTIIELSVGSGSGTCTHWTSDLGVEYVRFNSEYTT
ncbi:MAG: bifunctional glutamate N-acetyltransferase/amino-acid acetyltransferase ArgJ [Pirellulaceae bacterium]|nr:bifunctional glutamate N-acetyltransferase/amino-acid acetyltransferase ArgJ [Pirellulaceae bacterium]